MPEALLDAVVHRDVLCFREALTEAALSGELRGRLSAWATLSLEPLAAAIGALQRNGFGTGRDAGVLCETLIDLLEGACNRIRLHDESGG